MCIITIKRRYIMANKDNNLVIGIDDIQDDLHQQVLFEQNKKKTEKE